MHPIQTLIIEDNAIHALTIEQYLIGMEYTVVGIARNDTEAIKLFKILEPDLIIMDIELSNSQIDGIELAEIFDKLNPTPLIYLTSHYDNIEIRKRALATLPSSFLFKPDDVNPSKLSVAISLALKSFSKRDNEKSEINESLYFKGDNIFIRDKGCYKKIKLIEITHLESSAGYTIIHTISLVKFIFTVTLASFLRKTNSNLFCRIHNSHAVNLNFLDDINLADMTCNVNFVSPSSGKMTIPLNIGKQHKDTIISNLNKLRTRK